MNKKQKLARFSSMMVAIFVGSYLKEQGLVFEDVVLLWAAFCAVYCLAIAETKG